MEILKKVFEFFKDFFHGIAGLFFALVLYLCVLLFAFKVTTMIVPAMEQIVPAFLGWAHAQPILAWSVFGVFFLSGYGWLLWSLVKTTNSCLRTESKTNNCELDIEK